MKIKTLILPAVVSALLIFTGLVFASDPEQTADGQLMTDKERTEWFNQMLNSDVDVNGDKKKNRIQVQANEHRPSLLGERPPRENSLTPNVKKINPAEGIEPDRTHRY